MPAAPPADVRTRQHVVPVHPLLPIIGFTASVVLAAFAAVVVLLPSGPGQDGRAPYISEGFEQHCGWSGVVMGSAGSLVVLCELVAAVHVGRADVVACTLLQLLGWNVVLGVEGTGWDVHYAGLAVFLLSGLYYHFVMARSAEYGFAVYRQASAAAFLAATLFVVGVGVAHSLPPDTEAWRVAGDVAVALEFALLCTIVCETIALMWAMNGYSSIHLVFVLEAPAAVPAVDDPY